MGQPYTGRVLGGGDRACSVGQQRRALLSVKCVFYHATLRKGGHLGSDPSRDALRKAAGDQNLMLPLIFLEGSEVVRSWQTARRSFHPRWWLPAEESKGLAEMNCTSDWTFHVELLSAGQGLAWLQVPSTSWRWGGGGG
jgi:hypothetical protein